ncbi:MAG: fructose-1,6-bisphosphatase [Balneolaceae bacterium]|nr:MAG: fructose-1,6-bisphosphatase [Balneolaceae bacterium]
MSIKEQDLRYLRLLATQYPTIRAASTEIINLSAILELPKGTEHFISDIHGEDEAFLHVLRNGSGSVRRKIEDVFQSELTEREKRTLATLIYYPEKKLPMILKCTDDPDEWFKITLFRLIRLCRVISSKYTRSYVRKALPFDFAYIIEELLHEQESIANRQEYYKSIIETIIQTDRADAFIMALANLVQRLSISHLHVIGDVYDRGPGAHIIMDRLMEYHSVDFQWGNHDIVWMGAAAGSGACITNVIRISLRYANMETLENGYAVSLLPLASLAMELYGSDPCERFWPKSESDRYSSNELQLMARMHKAITIIQLKLEGQIIKRRPHYQMNDRLLLGKIDPEEGTITIDGLTYPLLDNHFPTVDPDHPYELTDLEKTVLQKIRLSFANSERLQKHVRFLYSKGSMYQAYNGNLLFHGCIPMNPDGTLRHYVLDGKDHSPREFMDRLERLARQGYFADELTENRQLGLDTLWYLWSGAHSPLFGKEKMATFERYFIADKQTHVEEMNPYYQYRTRQKVIEEILTEFGLDPEKGHVLNGHVPVKVKKGESPLKAGGKLIVIDGGFAKAYQSQTGIAGYTLIYNSYGMLLASHEPFESVQKAVEQEIDIHSEMRVVEHNRRRIRVKDTDSGKMLQQKIDELQELLQAYRSGLIKEKA